MEIQLAGPKGAGGSLPRVPKRQSGAPILAANCRYPQTVPKNTQKADAPQWCAPIRPTLKHVTRCNNSGHSPKSVRISFLTG